MLKEECQVELIRKKINIFFYDCCLFYLKLRENSFGDEEYFVWTENSVFIGPDMEVVAEKKLMKHLEKQRSVLIICLMKLSLLIPHGHQNMTKGKEIVWDKKMAHNFQSFQKKQIVSVPNLRNATEYVCLFVYKTSVSVQRVFL